MGLDLTPGRNFDRLRTDIGLPSGDTKHQPLMYNFRIRRPMAKLKQYLNPLVPRIKPIASIYRVLPCATCDRQEPRLNAPKAGKNTSDTGSSGRRKLPLVLG